jgi:alpha-glucosidase
MKYKWWQTAVFYQIYPRSFADENGDGIGDIPGMIEKLDYLKSLGIDGIWLSPHYPSPNIDCGYDIADYSAVAPEYGTLDDFRRFLDEAHKREIRVILDLVLNHTSDQHTWFIESASSRDNPKRDWYIWRDGKDGNPPNNWYSTFGGSAWEWDEVTGQYYYHFFFREQPDLNWRNPEVKKAMFDAVRFWLDMGVDGFRLDAIGTVYEDPDLPDQKSNYTLSEMRSMDWASMTPEQRKGMIAEYEAMFGYQSEQPGLHDLLKELRAVVDEYDGDRLLVGESDEIMYHGTANDELHMVFNFPLMRTERLTSMWVRSNQQQRLAELAAVSPEAWPCNTLGNHDSPRVYSRYGDKQHDDEIARLSLALMMTLRGTPFLYNGEEIGMTDLMLDDISKFRDMFGVWHYQAYIEELGMSPGEALKLAVRITRDKNRTPMQWRNAANAGFSPEGVETWLPVNPNYAQGVNVEDQENDPSSLLNFYRQMIRLRCENPALSKGSYIPIQEDDEDILAFLRKDPETDQTLLIVLNLSERACTLSFQDLDQYLPGLSRPSIRYVYSNRDRSTDPNDLFRILLAPFEITIAEVIEVDR